MTALLIASVALLVALSVLLVAAGLVAYRWHLQARERAGRREQARLATEAARAVEREQGPSRVGYRVTVHTKQPDDQTLFGVVAEEYADRIVLVDAEYVTSDGGKPIPGQPHIATRDIAWYDVHQLVAVPEHAGALAPARQET